MVATHRSIIQEDENQVVYQVLQGGRKYPKHEHPNLFSCNFNTQIHVIEYLYFQKISITHDECTPVTDNYSTWTESQYSHHTNWVSNSIYCRQQHWACQHLPQQRTGTSGNKQNIQITLPLSHKHNDMHTQGRTFLWNDLPVFTGSLKRGKRHSINVTYLKCRVWGLRI